MKSMLAMAALLAILLSGCTYSSQYNVSAGNNSTVSASQPSAPVPEQPAANGTAPQPSGSGSPQDTTQPAGAPSTPPGTDLSGKTFSDLINSGYPSRCSLAFQNSSGGAVSLELFFDGKGSMRMEQASTGSVTCPAAALVFKGDSEGNGTLYLSCPGDASALGKDFSTDTPCAWNAWNISSTYGGVGSATMGINDYQSPMIGDEPASDYSCQPWTLDSTKFDTPGFACW